MKEHVRIRKDYTLLVRAGKLNEAQKILEHIWDRKKSLVKPETEEKMEVKEEIKTSPNKEMLLDDLTKIKGVGKKTVEDIKIMFNNIDELKEALKNGRVALRDDVVDKLKEYLS